MNSKYTLNYIKENNLILLEAITGSNAYGTNNEHSDVDYRGVYICEFEDFLIGDYPPQISDEKNDITFYEIGRYMELVVKNNPNILELLQVPEDCIIQRHEIFNLINPIDYVSKLCQFTLGGYAGEQIKKARGLNKKINNPVEVKKKSPLDFCYAIDGSQTKSLKSVLYTEQMEQLFCGVCAIPHAKDMYALFYDQKAHDCFSELVPLEERELLKSNLKSDGKTVGLGYKGIVKDNSNEIRLSSIPKEEEPIITFCYNKDGYKMHCKEYTEYFEWVENRNVHRYAIAKENDYDPKNMMHCYRLSEMSLEIAEEKGIIVRRPNRDFLMNIRNGKLDYNEILDLSEGLMNKSKEIFSTSKLREEPDYTKGKEVLLEIRKSFYNLK